MLIQNKALELAVDFHKAFAHMQGFQNPEKVVDTALIFMSYFLKYGDNSVVESADKKQLHRNPSKSDNSK